QDDWCTPAAVDALTAKLEAGGVTHELFRYDAQHAFFNEQRAEVYAAEAAEQSWERTLAFLKAHL
ncbi:MAG: dienelactone hydrolase family protein, partial [bacterium]